MLEDKRKPDDALWRMLMRATIGVLLLVLAVSTILLHTSLLRQIRFDGENSAMESEPLYAMARCEAGETLYCDYAHPPYVITAYMPLFYVIPGWIAKQVGGGWLDMVLVGRLYAYLFWVGVAVVVYALARRAGCARLIALIAGLLWGAGQLAPGWANSFKPDSVTLFFSLLAVWVYQRDDRLATAALAMALLAVAYWHKHTAVAPLAAILMEEWFRGRRQRAGALAATWVLVVVAGLLAMELGTTGRFSANVFRGLLEHAPWRWPLFLLGGSIVLGFVPLMGGALACVTLPSVRRPALLRRYFGLALAVAFGGTLIRGTLGNHYLEPLAVGCVLAAVLIDHWLRESTPRSAVWVRVGLLLAMLLMSLVPLAARATTLFTRVNGTDAWWTFVADYAKLTGPLLVEDSYLAVRQGAPPVVVDVDKFASLQRNGLFDDTELMRQITEGHFRAIVTKYPLDSGRAERPLPLRWRTPIREHYYQTRVYLLPGRRGNVYIYEPVSPVGPDRRLGK